MESGGMSAESQTHSCGSRPAALTMKRTNMRVDDLSVELLNPGTGCHSRVLDGVSMQLSPGELVGVTGPSGGGKSTLASALAGLLPDAARVRVASCQLGSFNLSSLRDVLSGQEWSQRTRLGWGASLFLISQDARSTLFPHRTVEWHLRRADAIARRQQVGQDRWRPEQALEEVGFASPEEYLRRLPSGLSTGECQRVQWVMASRLPIQWLIADEPFASVDEERALHLAGQLREVAATGRAVLLISHHLALLRRVADSMLVVHHGQVLTRGAAEEVLVADEDTIALQSQPQATSSVCVPTTSVELVLKATNLTKSFGRSHWWNASKPTVVLENCQFEIPVGARVGLLGKSGRGKTTFARIIMGLTAPTSGTIERLPSTSSSVTGTLAPEECHELWRHFQMVHQDTDLVFDPSCRLGDALVQVVRAARPELSQSAAWQHAGQSLQRFGLAPDVMLAPATRLSGGEKRRAAIVRSLLTMGVNWLTAEPQRTDAATTAVGRTLLPVPRNDGQECPSYTSPVRRLLILDEPTVGLDRFWQQVVRDELLAVQRPFGLTYFVISHDRNFVREFCEPQYIVEWKK